MRNAETAARMEGLGPARVDARRWRRREPKTKVATAWDAPSDEDFRSADVMVFCKRIVVTIPMMWNRTSGKGRVHVNIMGHYSWTFNDPLFRALLLRAIAWAAHQPVDRFNALVPVGVTLKG